jgi:hypothetical protein
MRNLLALLALLLLVIGGAGWYLGWFTLHTQPGDSGHRKVSIDIDTNKIGQDLHKGEEHLQDIIKNANKSGTDTKTTKEEAKDPKKNPGKTSASPTEGDLRAKGLPLLPDPLHPPVGPLLTPPESDPHPLVEQALLNPRKR